MGAAVSRNHISIMADVISKVSSSVATKSISKNDQTSIIKVTDTASSVVIQNNIFQQMATVNQSNLLKTLNNASVQQDMVQQATQQAKSSIGGLNLGQFSEAENYAEMFHRMSIDICNSISSVCLATNNQVISIIVDKSGGDVKIINNLSDQMGVIFNDCVTASANSSDAGQKLTQILEQKAESKAEGLDLTTFFIALILGFSIFTFGSMYFGKSIMTMLFPIIGVVGIGLCIYYAVLIAAPKTEKPTVPPPKFKRVGFKAEGIPSLFPLKNPTQTLVVPYSRIIKITNETSDRIFAFTWARLNSKSENGTITFYDDFTATDIKKLIESPLEIIPATLSRIVTSGNDSPKDNIDNGDIYLNITTGEFFQKEKLPGSAIDIPATWKLTENSKQSKTSPLQIGKKMELLKISNPKGSILKILADAAVVKEIREVGNCLAVYCPENPNEFLIYQFFTGGKNFIYIDSVKLGGLKVNSASCRESFVSGYYISPTNKEEASFGNTIYLIFGVILTILGFGGYAVEKIYGDDNKYSKLEEEGEEEEKEEMEE